MSGILNKLGLGSLSATTTDSSTTPSTATTTNATTTSKSTTPATTADGYMTRSEERLLVGKEKVSAGTASLNKYVTTEHAHTSVPVTKEHAVIEREPITAADNIKAGKIEEAHIEVPLTAERAVASKEAVAVEKVKLRKEVEQSSQNVDADLRKEHIEYGTTAAATHSTTRRTSDK